MNIASRIAMLRQAMGWSKNKLAQESHLSQAYISQLEAGMKEPTTTTLQRICAALNISLADFFAEDASELPPDLRQLLREAEVLTPDQRKALTEFIRTLKAAD